MFESGLVGEGLFIKRMSQRGYKNASGPVTMNHGPAGVFLPFLCIAKRITFAAAAYQAGCGNIYRPEGQG